MAWIGRKKLAFVPVYRPNARPPDQIPQDWVFQIERRIFYDPDPTTGADRSLRTYIHTVSSGLADLDALIWEMQTIDQQDVPPNALEGAPGPFGETLGSWLRNHEKCDAAAIVMLGGVGAGTSAGFWCRFVMAEGVGTWAMEFMHSLTGFADLYPFGGNMGAFDQMACACGTHPSAFTKRAVQWLEPSAIRRHTEISPIDGSRVINEGFTLYPVGLIQPPPDGFTTAVEIGSKVPYYLVEARKKVDQFDRGIRSEGVIVYRIQTTDPLGHAQNDTAPIQLMTPTALTPGQVYVTETDVSISVTGILPDGLGYLVIINSLPWRNVSEGSTTPGGRITAIVTGPSRVTLILADPNGGVYATAGSYDAGWGPWRSVSEGRTMPGAPITAVLTGSNRVTLFLADPNGGVYTTAGNYDAGWGPWRNVSEGSSTPGAPITAVVTGPDRVTLFLADPNGGVYTTAGSYDAGWGPWRSVSEGSSAPGGRITAIVMGPNRVTLFLADPNGGVYTTAGNYDAGWGPWRSVSEGSSTPGAPIAALLTAPDRITLFLVDLNGAVYTTSGRYDANWGPWRIVPDRRSTPGAPVAAVVTGPNQVALFLADRDGRVYATTTSPP
jgi:hypothetical protein